MVPSTIEGPSITDPPLAKLHRIFPVRPSSAYMLPEYDPAYMTPFAVLTAPMSNEPAVGSAVCHSTSPVATSSADHDPQSMVGPFGNSV